MAATSQNQKQTAGSITLYVDVVSPFAYLAYYMLRNHPLFRSVEITYIPIFLGGLLKACNNRAPLEIKNKDKWINIERLRWAHQFDIPISSATPEGFPKPTIQAMRFLTALQIIRPDLVPLALDTLYAIIWTDDGYKLRQGGQKPQSAGGDTGNKFNERSGLVFDQQEQQGQGQSQTTAKRNPTSQFNERSGITMHKETNTNTASEARGGKPPMSQLIDPAFFGPILAKVLGQDVVAEILEKHISSPEVKKQLSENTDQAIADGAFGLPWFKCRNGRGDVEGFWGFDHLGQVVRFLGLDDDEDNNDGEGKGQKIRALL
ncbi:hypothetical protein HRR83_007057 [Exophiala dermatitidis]|uniref:DSBA-like thioredoxin domain-containing protein n=1 Tax=Exophiala dermatitidis TaxID=5970 RepID=A0AAN6EQC4_EXODE|nr:hypothetical protein HRR75_005754 [Exophiala dermatitidis]KAJ4512541.1 hypothetical protein HRR73_006096 [Exophiala dermatitidis]KAJ4512585.1 hypothetical protein HRR74_006283 [Exophiala dermatitidis]KAJ4542380.1 hypothetical protein HRR77_005587 [Exophiala dermatitidis]KAJ4548067.1 hypothetical protein HRR76_000684 [Exophiala dermatitidis]